MPNDDMFSGDIDPEIASLLGINGSASPETPNYENLFNEEATESTAPRNPDVKAAAPSEAGKPDKETFSLPQNFRQNPNPLLSHAKYYKAILNDEGELAQSLHDTMSSFLKEKDPKEKTNYRLRLTSRYWQLYGNIASKIMSLKMEPKRFLLRYGLLLPNIVSKDQREMLGSIIEDNTTGEPIHYVDEWLEQVAGGLLSPLASDDLKPTKMSGDKKIKIQLDKAKGKREAYLTSLRSLQIKRQSIENVLNNKMKDIFHHTEKTTFPGLESLYTEIQSRLITESMNHLRELSSLHKEMSSHYSQLRSADQDFQKLQEKARESGASADIDPSELEKEAGSLRQMAKMCVGRQGNHFPILMKHFLTSRLETVATRENVIKVLMDIEYLDPGMFRRTFKQKTNRIVPHIILIPCYGDYGICWEPFERYNRATSRGRIAIPMFPKDLKTAVIHAVADLRWQVAKEKAQHYWMEEGLTGHYYQYFSDHKMRGDVRLKFIEDYFLWIQKEGEGVQKLEREVRGIFWRDMPFPQELKDKLRKRGFVYNELYKKDLNRAASDGY